MITVVITNQEFTVSATNSVLQACESASYIIKKYFSQIYFKMLKSILQASIYMNKNPIYLYATCIIKAENSDRVKSNNFLGDITLANGNLTIFYAVVGVLAAAGLSYAIYQWIFSSKVETPTPPGDGITDKNDELSEHESVKSEESSDSSSGQDISGTGDGAGAGGAPDPMGNISDSALDFPLGSLNIPSIEDSVHELNKLNWRHLIDHADSLGVRNLGNLLDEIKPGMSPQEIADWGNEVSLLIPNADAFIDVAVSTTVPLEDLNAWSDTLNVTVEVLKEILVTLAINGPWI